MIRIALVCSFGMSTSLLVQSMEKVARQRGLAVEIEALGTGDVQKRSERIDVILLGPQVRYAQASLRRLGKPLAVIDPLVYAMARGEAALDQALALLGGEKN